MKYLILGLLACSLVGCGATQEEYNAQRAQQADGIEQRGVYSVEVDGGTLWCVRATEYARYDTPITCNWDAYNEQRRNR